MKKFFLVLLLMVNVYALDALGALDDENKAILNTILTGLDLKDSSANTKQKIYDKFSFALEKDWYVTFLYNDTPVKSKVTNADTKFIEMTLTDENRIYNITFIHFKKEKQLFVITRQYVPVNSDYLLKRFTQLKNDPSYKLKVEKSNYAYLSEDGYMSDTIIHIKNNYGIISYIDMTTLDL